MYKLQNVNFFCSLLYVHGRNADINLAEIHKEMSELLDKQVNIQKESLKIFPGFTQAPASPCKSVR